MQNSCPVETTLHLIGGKYKALILWSLVSHTKRFSQLHKEIANATPKMLTQQLRELEAEGLIQRKIYPQIPPKVEYSLTERGQSIYPVLIAMYQWGKSYLHQQGIVPCCAMDPERLNGIKTKPLRAYPPSRMPYQSQTDI